MEKSDSVKPCEALTRSVRQKCSAARCFSYRRGGSIRRIALCEICYLMSRDQKVVIVTREGMEELYGKLVIVPREAEDSIDVFEEPDLEDENTVILCVELTDGLLLSHGTRYGL